MSAETVPVLAYRLPTRPYNVIVAVNRAAAATGSMRYAMAAADADYNGHAVHVSWNEYRGYWIAWYTWAGREVLGRGSLSECLRAAKAEYDRGALGASASVHYPEQRYPGERMPTESREDFVRQCRETGYVENLLEGAREPWWTPLHEKVGDAMSWERHGLAPAVGFLVASKTVEEYEAKLKAHLDARRARVG